jgi:CheY-like chemotaxis protein
MRQNGEPLIRRRISDDEAMRSMRGRNLRGATMGQFKPFRPRALVVEDEPLQRELLVALLEECDFDVLQCESAEAAELILQKVGSAIVFLFTDVNLAGSLTGAELATSAREQFPELRIVVTSGYDAPDMPDDVRFLPKPWFALDVLREAERTRAHFN